MLSGERSVGAGGFLVQYDRWVVRELELTREKLKWYWDTFTQFRSLGIDKSDEDDCQEFVDRFLGRKYVLWEIMEDDKVAGLWVLENPAGPTCHLHAYFFDRNLSEKTALSSYLVKMIFILFAIHRLCITVPTMYFSTIRLAQRVGMRKEGELVESVMLNGRWANQTVLGILREEVLHA